MIVAAVPIYNIMYRHSLLGATPLWSGVFLPVPQKREPPERCTLAYSPGWVTIKSVPHVRRYRKTNLQSEGVRLGHEMKIARMGSTLRTSHSGY